MPAHPGEDYPCTVGKLILLLVVIAVVIYVVVRLIETKGALFRRGGGGGSNAVRRPQPPRRPTGPLGPDDDPEFLRDLNRRSRRKDQGGSAPDQ